MSFKYLPVSSLCPALGLQMLTASILHRSGGLSSGPRACTTNAITTAPFPPPYSIFNIFKEESKVIVLSPSSRQDMPAAVKHRADDMFLADATLLCRSHCSYNPLLASEDRAVTCLCGMATGEPHTTEYEVEIFSSFR